MKVTSVWLRHGVAVRAAVLLFAIVGCQTALHEPSVDAGKPAVNPRARSARLVQDVSELPKVEGPDPTDPVGSVAASQPGQRVTSDEVQKHAPSPEKFQEWLANRPERLPPGVDNRYIEAVAARVGSVHRAKQIKLSLRDCVGKALQNNYAIRATGYGPAIEATRIVEAESRFDETVFLNFTSNRQDKPSSSQLQGTSSDSRIYEGGVRKLLATGMQLQASYMATRSASDLVFQTLNPAWFEQFVVEFKQPFLRGFGLDYNRSQIELYRIDRRISMEQFRRNLQEMLFNVEQAYWQLKKARADVVAISLLLADFERIDRFLEARKGFDTYPIQRGQVRSRLETRKTEFVARRARVLKAEDVLKSLLNDPDLTLAQDIEVIPAEDFDIEPLLLDRLGEVQAALDHRPELSEAQLTIEKARVGLGVAKNQSLPRFDVVFRYIVDGLGDSWDRSFRKLSDMRYNEYYVGLEFEWPIGNRGPEAAIRRARLQESQAVTTYAAQIEKIITEVHGAVRDVQTAYEQLGSSVMAVQASTDVVQATRERALARDPTTLQMELDVLDGLAQAREVLTNTLVNHNVALVNLEFKKGTLLEYNNIELRDPEANKPVRAGLVPVDPDPLAPKAP